MDNPYAKAHVGARHVQRPDIIRNLLLLVHHLNPDVVLRVIKREVVFQTVFPAAVRAPVLKQRSGDCLIHGIGQLIVNAPVYHHVDPLDALGTKEMYPFGGSHFSTLLSRSNSFERNAPVPAVSGGVCYPYFIKQRMRLQQGGGESVCMTYFQTRKRNRQICKTYFCFEPLLSALSFANSATLELTLANRNLGFQSSFRMSAFN